jgi:hypothetical protein
MLPVKNKKIIQGIKFPGQYIPADSALTVGGMITKLKLLKKMKKVKDNDVLCLFSNKGGNDGFSFEGYLRNICAPKLIPDSQDVEMKDCVINYICVADYETVRDRY